MGFFEDKRVLITGGTGSFGKFITRKLLDNNVEEIRIFSRDEEKQLDMMREFDNERLSFVIGNVRDYDRVLEATENINILYHAAALKIIHHCEKHPVETLKTNVLGTINIKKAAIQNRIQRNIFISTDKAVESVNFYGMTKGIAEKIWVNEEFSHDRTSRFAVVRYGNVLGSRGSVVPYFKQLIDKNLPLTITHPSMTRFLITLERATELVFHATQNMTGGEIYVPDIPSCNILDLARAVAGENYPLKHTGIRAGEKIHECMIQEDEFRRVKEAERFYIIYPPGRHETGKVKERFTSENARRLEIEEIRQLLKGVL